MLAAMDVEQARRRLTRSGVWLYVLYLVRLCVKLFFQFSMRSLSLHRSLLVSFLREATTLHNGSYQQWCGE
jgi:hypothetical protein